MRLAPRDALDYNRQSVAPATANGQKIPFPRTLSRHFADPSLVSIFLSIIAALVGLAVGYAAGRARRGEPRPMGVSATPPPAAVVEVAAPPERASSPPPPASPATPSPAQAPLADDRTTAERARLIRSYEAEAALGRRALAGRDAAIAQLADFADERRRLFGDVAAARAETARYRQLVIDLENNAAPQFFGVDAPDDLKLIVGIGPVLERMLQMMGVATYRQIARWSERDIDEFDARLHEFPGRIRRDAWVTQARALHQSKYGEALPQRGRG